MLNRVILIGNLVNDPEMKYTPSGIAVATFRLAVDRPMSAEARTQGKERQTDFIDIVAWRQSAEFAANYLNKGRLVAIEGKLQIREYVTQDGQRRKVAEVVADNVKGLDRARDAEGSEAHNEGGGGQEQHEPRPAPAPRAAAPAGGTRSAAPPAAATRAGGSQRAAANDAFEDDMSDLSDPFAE